jgi:prepilin-type N-terminal cleavage/methylation domain-containing protein
VSLQRRHRSKRAFSLVELSIVLVILGLLVGGVLSGQSLIRAAELRAVSTEYSRYVTAVQSFRDKYFAIPGDMANATAFWGFAGGTGCTNSSGTATTSPGTCDGNGDGTLNVAGAVSQTGEFAQLWRQLALAGLIEGSYSGLAGSGGTQHCVIGTDCPRSKLSNTGWGALSRGSTGDANFFTMEYGNGFILGAASTVYLPSSAVLKPEEAWNIDTKIDDGKPAQGKVVTLFWNNLCSAADDGSSDLSDLVASYRLSDTAARCAFVFRQAF